MSLGTLAELRDHSAGRAQRAGSALGGQSGEKPFDPAGTGSATGARLSQIVDFIEGCCVSHFHGHLNGGGLDLHTCADGRVRLHLGSFDDWIKKVHKGLCVHEVD